MSEELNKSFEMYTYVCYYCNELLNKKSINDICYVNKDYKLPEGCTKINK